MNTDTITSPSNWHEFRARLFELLEARRAIATTFDYSQIYFFITRCMSAFNSPGSKKAEAALDAVADDGTFRLVADSYGDFLAMFPTTLQSAEERGRPLRPNSKTCQEQQSGPAVGPEAKIDVPSPAGKPGHEACARRGFSSPGLHRSANELDALAVGFVQPPLPARRSSEIPLDRGKAEKLMNQARAVDSLPATRVQPEETSTGRLTGAESIKRKPTRRGTTEDISLNPQEEAVLRELLSQGSWPLADVKRITGKVGLMPWACLATLNDWAMQTYGDLIAEGDQIITINQKIKHNIKT